MESQKFKWRTGSVDYEGPFGWEKIGIDILFGKIIPKLHEIETKTWKEIESSGSHSVSRSGCCKMARDRLSKIALDSDSLFSLRLSGKLRLWGVRDRSVLHLLWYDPNHEVCPAELKNT